MGGYGGGEDMGGGDDTGRSRNERGGGDTGKNSRRAAPGHGIGRRTSEKLATGTRRADAPTRPADRAIMVTPVLRGSGRASRERPHHRLTRSSLRRSATPRHSSPSAPPP